MSTHRVTNPKFENLGCVKQSKKQLSSGHLAAAAICQARVIHCRVLLKTKEGQSDERKNAQLRALAEQSEKIIFCLS